MDAQKLAKVLALAASDNDAEALHALRTAKRLLDQAGCDFVEVGRRLAASPPASHPPLDDLEDAVFDLRNEIRHLRAENERLRQGRPPQAPAAESPSLAQAAETAATAIRLRAELAELRDALEIERADTLRLRAAELSFREQLLDALSESGRMSARLDEADGRRMRLEAENRRLATAAQSLKTELDEAVARIARLEAERVATLTREELTGHKPRKIAHGPAKEKATKGRGAGQFALF